MRPQNRSQGVDIDLDALRDTQKKLGGRRVQLLQSPTFANETHTVELPAESMEPRTSMAAANEDTYVTSWAEGQGSERLDRRLAKRKNRKPKKAAGHGKCDGPSAAAPEPRMVLLHGDVLELPVPPTIGGISLEQPDIVASLNYAMAYFHDRSTLIRYLKSVAQSLRPKTGVFITDMFGGPPTGEAYENQDELWSRFWNEPGFLRTAEDAAQFQLPTRAPDTDDDDLVVRPAPSDTERGTRAEWPRGKLKMVRTGTAHGGFEYWREDGPIDYTTNRFRMSLSFRFADHSWLRDVFSYDFRIWSLKEVRFPPKKKNWQIHALCFGSLILLTHVLVHISLQKRWMKQALLLCECLYSHATISTSRTSVIPIQISVMKLLPCFCALRKKKHSGADSTQYSLGKRYFPHARSRRT